LTGCSQAVLSAEAACFPAPRLCFRDQAQSGVDSIFQSKKPNILLITAEERAINWNLQTEFQALEIVFCRV